MSEWEKYKLGDIVTTNKHNLGKDYPHTNIKYLNTGSITEGKIEGFQNYAIEDAPSRAKRLVEHEDIIYSTVRPIQRHYGFIENPDEELVVSTGFTVISSNKEKADPKFIYYFLASDEIVELLEMIAEGSTSAYPSLKISDIEKLNISLPPLPEQNAVASILSSLDDKINLLYRQNRTLEAMAETLFRQWFVEEKEEDWKEKPLSKIANFLNGKACQKYPPKNEADKLPVLKIKELRNGVTENSDWASTEIDDEYIVENGDVIFSWSASLLVKIWNGQRCILNQHLFKVTSQNFPKWFYFSWCKYHLEQFIAIAKAHATTMGHIRRKDLDKAMVKIPPGEILEEMTEKMSPLVDKIIANNQQIMSLEKLRDTLLPKLMSGEVRVALGEGQKQAVTIQSNGKKKRNIQFEEAILISAIIKAFYAPKIGNVSRQWYQKISYLHKRKLKDSQANVFELTEEYGKKAAGPYKKEMRYQGPEGIAISNGYIEPVNKQAFKPADKIKDIDKYFYERDYWNWKVFENWTVSTLKFVRVKKLGVWATVDYCLIELKEMGEDLTADNIIAYLSKSEEWNHKLNQSEFSPENIELAMEELFRMYKY